MRHTSLVVSAVAAVALLAHASALAQELKKLNLPAGVDITIKI